MTVTGLLLFGVAGVLILLLLKPFGGEIRTILRCVILLSVLGAAVSAAATLVSSMDEILTPLGLPESFSLLRRALGVAFATTLASGLCRELGEGGIADSLELFGKIQLLLFSLPLVRDLLTLAGTLLDAGGIT